MSSKRPPVPPMVIEVPVDELRRLSNVLEDGNKAALTTHSHEAVRELVKAQGRARDILRQMFARPRRIASEGSA